MLGNRTTASLSFEEIDPEQYDGLVIVGGSGSQVHLWNDAMLVHLVKFFQKSGKVIAAICLAPVVLAHAGILKGKKAAYFESPASDFEMKKRRCSRCEGPCSHRWPGDNGKWTIGRKGVWGGSCEQPHLSSLVILCLFLSPGIYAPFFYGS
jgi:hypothetical protein